MPKANKIKKTIVGDVRSEVLAYTAGEDTELDLAIAEYDCIGTAAHVTMLSGLPLAPPLVSPAECKRVVGELAATIDTIRAGRFSIRLADQDVHMAVERRLTDKLGAVGKKVHTGRSRNDQVAVDLRLFAKIELLGAVDDAANLCDALLRLAGKHRRTPMVGRTHQQPAMPSSVALWAAAHVDSLLDDLAMLRATLDLNDQCPLGAAAGYGVPLPLDRKLTARLLGFRAPVHTVLHATNARGKIEYTILSTLGQVMVSLSRLAQDLILYSMPEFGYFALPTDMCTGSSIMPQKNNPDVLELVRAKASRVLGHSFTVADSLRAMPSGYNRDVQETKRALMDGLQVTRSSLRIMAMLVAGVEVNRKALLAGFTPGVFATDRALELVAGGMPFRDAYQEVKANLDDLATADPVAAIAAKTHYGAPGGLDLAGSRAQVRAARAHARRQRTRFGGAVSRLLGRDYQPPGA